MQAVMALMRLHRCAGSSEPPLLANVISTQILGAGSNNDDGKCSKNANTFLFLSPIRILFFRPGIQRNTCQNNLRIANREEPDQTASSEAA